jgi:hypothetical protein
MMRRCLYLLAIACVFLLPRLGAAFERTEEREPCAERNPLRNPYFGDTHVHTTFSYDAWGQGTRNTPRDAYRFAKGEAVGVQPYDTDGKPLRTVRLRRPLDFAVVTDHAELLGENHICRTPDVPGYNSLVCIVSRRWPMLAYSLINSQILDISDPRRYSFCGPEGRECIEAAAVPWKEIQDAAEEAYDRSAACDFTSFVGFEWSGAPDSGMIHRNVIFRNAVVPRLPMSYVEDRTPERLWQRLRGECIDLHQQRIAFSRRDQRRQAVHTRVRRGALGTRGARRGHAAQRRLGMPRRRRERRRAVRLRVAALRQDARIGDAVVDHAAAAAELRA